MCRALRLVVCLVVAQAGCSSGGGKPLASGAGGAHAGGGGVTTGGGGGSAGPAGANAGTGGASTGAGGTSSGAAGTGAGGSADAGGGAGGNPAADGGAGRVGCFEDAAPRAIPAAPDAAVEVTNPATDGPGADLAGLDPQFLSFCAAVRETMAVRLERCQGYWHEQAEALVNLDPCVAWGTAIQAGRMAFDPTKAAACIAALETNSQACTRNIRPAACTGALKGLVGPGVFPCNPNRDLTLDDRVVSNEPFLFGECAGDVHCLKGSAGVSICGSYGNLVIGASPVGIPCVSSENCGDSLFCDQPTRTCMPVHACTSNDQCTPPARCAGHVCVTDPVSPTCCKPGTTGVCLIGEQCLADTNCHRYALLGESCATGADPHFCLVGNCNETTLKCELAGPDGNCGANVNASNATCGPNQLCVHLAGAVVPYWTCTGPVY
jgi:hypothetical protein